MGTRSRVGIDMKDENNVPQIRSIYIHWDGYPKGVGQYLLDNLTDEESIHEYIGNGDRSTVEQSYYEMREEVAPCEWHSQYDWPDCGQEYEYLFENGEWLVKDLYGKNSWVSLKEVLDK